MIIEAEVYKTIITKIETYKKSDRRFKRLNNNIDIERYKAL